MTILEKLDQWPPYLCRIVARDLRTKRNQRQLSLLELKERSGLSLCMVQKLSYRRTWSGVSTDTVSQFMTACRVDPFHARRHREWLKRRKKVALKGNRRKYVERILSNALLPHANQS